MGSDKKDGKMDTGNVEGNATNDDESVLKEKCVKEFDALLNVLDLSHDKIVSVAR